MNEKYIEAVRNSIATDIELLAIQALIEMKILHPTGPEWRFAVVKKFHSDQAVRRTKQK